jgi:hypothetical protein
MKITVFVPIAEGTPEITGEYHDHIGHFNPYPLTPWDRYVRHVIEVPEGEDWFYYRFNHSERWASIRMPRPKVKKWRWYLDFEGMRVTTDNHMENHPSNLSHLCWRKVEGSEVAE